MATPKYLTIDHLTIPEAISFFRRVEHDPDTGCWNWTGYLNPSGYGQWKSGGIQTLTHRVMYALRYGPIPVQARGSMDAPVVDHVCRNRRCCNPAHLRLISQGENTLCGEANSAKNARKTHCKNGHQLPETKNKFGQRVCKICRAAYERARTDVLARALQWQKQNPERRREINKAYRARKKAKHAASAPAP